LNETFFSLDRTHCPAAYYCRSDALETVTLSSVGGIIGIICGIGASSVLSIYAHWPTLISIGSIAIALFSAAVGVFFGFYPARKAAALDPIEALRYE
jgi:ABC-type antimicrobial peptide transport system permease subunit